MCLHNVRNVIMYLHMSRQCLDMSKQCLDIPLWCQWHCQWHHCIHYITMIKWVGMTFFHVMPLVPALLSCNANCIIKGTIFFMMCNMAFLVTWCQFWQHMILMVLSKAPQHLLVQDYQNWVQHDFFSHLTLLELATATCAVYGIVNSTIVSRWLKQCAP